MLINIFFPVVEIAQVQDALPSARNPRNACSGGLQGPRLAFSPSPASGATPGRFSSRYEEYRRVRVLRCLDFFYISCYQTQHIKKTL